MQLWIIYFVLDVVIFGFQSLHGYGFNDNLEGDSPYFVRRWAPKVNKAMINVILIVDFCVLYLTGLEICYILLI